MTRSGIRSVGTALALLAMLTGCSLFEDEERLSGERINIRNAQIDSGQGAVQGGTDAANS